MKNLPCISRTLKTGLKELIILVDCGSTNNYIRADLHLGNRIKLNQNTIAKTPHGVSKIQYKQEIRLLKQNLHFYEFDKLHDFDMILGEKSLREMKAQINLFEYKLYYSIPKENQKNNTQKINFTNDCPTYANRINELMLKMKKFIQFCLSLLR